MEEMESLQICYDIYGECEPNKNKMLLDNCDRIGVINLDFNKYITAFNKKVDVYIDSYFKAQQALTIKPNEFRFDRLFLSDDGAFDTQYVFADFTKLSNCWQYEFHAKRYYKLEAERLAVLLELVKLKESIINCLIRVRKVKENVSKNYSNKDAFMYSSNSKKLTKQIVIKKAEEMESVIKSQVVKLKNFNKIPTIEDIARMNIELNIQKNTFETKINANGKMII